MDFKVLIQCNTYNQSSFIKETLDCFVSQKVEFPFLAVIIDDASTDGEQTVLCDYLRSEFRMEDHEVAYEKENEDAYVYFAQNRNNQYCYFAVFLLKKNHYSISKDKNIYLSEWISPTNYIAFCEGDDYWCSPDKLRKQVEILDSRQDVGLCYSRAGVVRERTTTREVIGWEVNKDLLLANVIPTVSVCFRSCYFDAYFRDDDLLNLRGTWSMGDYPLWIFISQFSKICFLDEVLCVYRIRSESASHFRDLAKEKAFEDSTYAVQCYFYNRFYKDDGQLKNKIDVNHSIKLFNIFFKYGCYREARKSIRSVRGVGRKLRLVSFFSFLPFIQKRYKSVLLQ